MRLLLFLFFMMCAALGALATNELPDGSLWWGAGATWQAKYAGHDIVLQGAETSGLKRAVTLKLNNRDGGWSALEGNCPGPDGDADGTPSELGEVVMADVDDNGRRVLTFMDHSLSQTLNVLVRVNSTAHAQQLARQEIWDLVSGIYTVTRPASQKGEKAMIAPGKIQLPGQNAQTCQVGTALGVVTNVLATGSTGWNVGIGKNGITLTRVNRQGDVYVRPNGARELTLACDAQTQCGEVPGRWPFTSTGIVQRPQLRYVQSEVLALMRNEVLARHGYIFADADVQKHFEAQPWYRRNSEGNNDHVHLSKNELWNINVILAEEQSRCDEPFKATVLNGGRVKLTFNDLLCRTLAEGLQSRWLQASWMNSDCLVRGIDHVVQAVIANPSGDVNPFLYMRTASGQVAILSLTKILEAGSVSNEVLQCSGPLKFIAGATGIKQGYNRDGEPQMNAVCGKRKIEIQPFWRQGTYSIKGSKARLRLTQDWLLTFDLPNGKKVTGTFQPVSRADLRYENLSLCHFTAQTSAGTLTFTYDERGDDTHITFNTVPASWPWKAGRRVVIERD